MGVGREVGMGLVGTKEEDDPQTKMMKDPLIVILSFPSTTRKVNFKGKPIRMEGERLGLKSMKILAFPYFLL